MLAINEVPLAERVGEEKRGEKREERRGEERRERRGEEREERSRRASFPPGLQRPIENV